MIGIDICDISRFVNMKNIDKFLEKYFNESEREYIEKFERKYESIAGIFSAKEAFVKAVGTGFGKIKLKDIEVTHNFLGRPTIDFSNFFLKKKFKSVDCSISHDGNFVVSVVKIDLYEENYLSINSLNCDILLKERDCEGHKGTFGKVAVIGGSTGMCGSIYLCSKSAFRTGSGLVYNICPKSISNIMQIKSVENIIVPIEDEGLGYFSSKSKDDIVHKLDSYDSIAIGCGLGRNVDYFNLISEIMQNYSKPIVIDGDAIFYLNKLIKTIRSRDNIVITPHTQEFSYLSGYNLDYINTNREEVLERYFFENKFQGVIVLKGKNTIVASKEKIFINNTGNDGMATAGSGDCLTGIILSLLGQKLDVFNSAKSGVFIHGLAGDIAAKKFGKDSLIASDIVENISEVIKLIRN